LVLPFIAALLTVGLVSVIVSLQLLAYGTLNTVVFNNNKNNNNNNNNLSALIVFSEGMQAVKLLRQSTTVLNWGCRLMQVVLYISY